MANGSVARHAKRWSRRRLTSRRKQCRQTLVPGPWCGHHREVRKADGNSSVGNMAMRNVNGDDSNTRLFFACARLASSFFPHFQSRTSSARSDSLRSQN